MKITFAYYVMLVNLLGTEASKDFKVPLERGRHSVSATAHTDAIRQKRAQLKKKAENMKDSEYLQTMKHHSIKKDVGGQVKNLGLYKDPLYKRVIDYFSPYKAPSPISGKKLGHMSFSDKSQSKENHGNHDLFKNAQRNFKAMETKKNKGIPKVGGDTYVDITNYMNL